MSEAREPNRGSMALQLLPEGILRLVLADLELSEEVRQTLADRHAATVGDLLALDWGEPPPLSAEGLEAVRIAIGRAMDRGLLRHSTITFDPLDWPSQQGILLVALDDDQRALLRALLGIDEEAVSLSRYARRMGVDLRVVEALAERTRSRLHTRARPLVAHLRDEVRAEFASLHGLLDGRRLAPGTMMQTMAETNEDPGLPLRLAAFCFPHDYHVQSGMLIASSRRALRRLVDQVRTTLSEHRLPLPLESLLDSLGTDRKAVPRGLVAHVIHHEIRLSIASTSFGEVVVPNPESTATRLEEILEEAESAMELDELVYAYRERHRRVTPRRLERRLRADPTFVMVGRDVFALRRWHATELVQAAPLADRAARHVCAEGGKQNVHEWLAAQNCEERSRWLVLDLLAKDDRVRLLGRGEACPATQRRSQVMRELLASFRQACGDVVESMFVANQPVERRRLVQRLLSENRLFLRPERDRVDTLTNYPFNDARLRRLRKVTRKALEEHGGYATAEVLVAAVNETDLGGSWLTPTLLEDVLRRQGWFEHLPGGLFAMSDRELGAHLLRLARHQLREASGLVTVDEIVRQRADLAEFRDCLAELLTQDPMIQSPDGRRFALV